jgi:hypothetical protein
MDPELSSPRWRTTGSVVGLGCADGGETSARENKCKGPKIMAHNDPYHARKKLIVEEAYCRLRCANFRFAAQFD